MAVRIEYYKRSKYTMLNKKLLEKQDRKRCVYQSLNYIFATTLDRLSAECVVLGETDMTPDAFAQMLKA